MGVAGYLVNILKAGTPTAMTSEAMSTDGSTVANRYQIDDSTKEVWQRTVAPTFRIGTSVSSTVSSTRITDLDYLFGRVTLDSASSGSLTVSGTYMPMASIGGANSYTLNQTADVLDITDFDTTGQRSKIIGLQDVSITIGAYASLLTTGAVEVFDDWQARTDIVLEVQPGGGTNPKGRGWFVVESDSWSGDVSGLETEDMSFQLDWDSTVANPWYWSDL